jgi:hypothetical protein
MSNTAEVYTRRPGWTRTHWWARPKERMDRLSAVPPRSYLRMESRLRIDNFGYDSQLRRFKMRTVWDRR